jgi:hypothetical protein
MSSSQPPRRPSTIDDLTRELAELIAEMNVPETRRDLGDILNLTWLLRKLEVGNPGHPKLGRAMELLRRVSDYHTTKAAYDSGRLPDRRSGFDRRAPKSGL